MTEAEKEEILALKEELKIANSNLLAYKNESESLKSSLNKMADQLRYSEQIRESVSKQFMSKIDGYKEAIDAIIRTVVRELNINSSEY